LPDRPRPTRRSFASRSRSLALLALVLTLAACEGPESFLDVAGPGSRDIAGVWWLMFTLGSIIWVLVIALVGVILWRKRRGPTPQDDERELRVERRFLYGGGIIMPAIILFVLFLTAAPVGVLVAPERGSEDGEGNPNGDETVIEIIGHQFWWEVHYPDHDITTANEIRIPAGEPVRLRLASADVIHAFWIPRLGPKVDMTPGHITELVVTADEPGHYRARCTEYCGIAHAQMIFHVFALAPDEFDDWAETTAQPPPEPETADAQEGQELFEIHCAACHTVRGQFPVSTVGPDLSDLAARETIASGILPNTREDLSEWILDPQELKPRNAMPPTPLDDDELEVLLDYLEGLQ
jgi:cytochrome c oxidase subunit II